MADVPRWSPGPELVERTNVGRFLIRHGLPDYPTLVSASIEDPEWFWHAAVNHLGIEFFTPYSKVLDDSAGIPWTRWFVGGTLNIAHNCLDRHAISDRRDQIALIWEGEDGTTRKFTYADLAAETNRVANALGRLGVAPGDRVGLFLPMLPETVAAFLAIAKLGAIVVPIFSGFGASAVADRLIDAGATVLITGDGFLRRGNVVRLKAVADEALALAPGVTAVVVVRRLGIDVPMIAGRDHKWEGLVAAESTECPSLPVDSEHPFLIIYTSGTTGKPKGAVHVHGGFLVKIAAEVAYQADLQEGDVLHWFSDMGWIMGPWAVVGGLALGGTLFLYEGAPDYPTPDRLWRQVAEHGITILGVSPTLIRALMKHGDAPVLRHDLSRLRILGSTGEPWNPEPWTWYFETVGGGRCPIINFSGGTEVGACFLSPTPLSHLKTCSLGGPALGMAVDVLDAEGRPTRGSVGELVCTKPWPGMTRGLWNDPDRYIQSYWSRRPGVWVHGDWASIDEDGEWFLHGRSDDTLKIAGKRLGPAEVESILVGHPAVSEAAAIGAPHEVKGEAIWCYLVARPGIETSEALADALRDRVAEALGKAFAPDRMVFVAELPRTRNGKILRRAIRARALGLDPGDLSNLDNVASLDSIAVSRPGDSSGP
jgi:acetyl-CoA synthetase